MSDSKHSTPTKQQQQQNTSSSNNTPITGHLYHQYPSQPLPSNTFLYTTSNSDSGTSTPTRQQQNQNTNVVSSNISTPNTTTSSATATTNQQQQQAATALPLSGKAIDHWLHVQRKQQQQQQQKENTNENNSNLVRTPSPAPRNPNLPPKPDMLMVASSSSPVALSKNNNMSPSSANKTFHPAIRIWDGDVFPEPPPLPPLSDIEDAESTARSKIMQEAAQTNFVEITVALSALLKSDLLLFKKRMDDAELEKYTNLLGVDQPLTVVFLLTRIAHNIQELGDRAVRPDRCKEVQVDTLTFPHESKTLQLQEENERLRMKVNYDTQKISSVSAFHHEIVNECVEEVQEANDAYERTQQELSEESEKRMSLEVDQLVFQKKSQHAKQVADEVNQALEMEKKSVDAERKSRVELECQLDNANAEVDAHTVSKAELETQAARVKLAATATNFATTEKAIQCNAPSWNSSGTTIVSSAQLVRLAAGGGSQQQKMDCGELSIDTALVPQTQNLLKLVVLNVKCVLRHVQFDKGNLEVDLLQTGGGVIRHVDDSQKEIYSSSSSSSSFLLSSQSQIQHQLQETTNISIKIPHLAFVDRNFEPENSIRIVSTQDSSHVDFIMNSRKECEMVFEALAFGRSTFASRCYIQRIWGSRKYKILRPSPMEADYKVKLLLSSSSSSSVVEQQKTNTKNNLSLLSSSSKSNNKTQQQKQHSLYITLQRMTQCRISYLSVDDIYYHNISEETLAEIANSAHLLVLWRFCGQSRMNEESGTTTKALSSVISLGKGVFKNWSAVIQDSCTSPEGTSQLMLAATKETQAWIGSYETARNNFCAQLSLQVTVLGSRLCFTTCNVGIHHRFGFFKSSSDKNSSLENENSSSTTKTTTENSTAPTLSLLQKNVFCDQVDCVFLLCDSSQISQVSKNALPTLTTYNLKKDPLSVSLSKFSKMTKNINNNNNNIASASSVSGLQKQDSNSDDDTSSSDDDESDEEENDPLAQFRPKQQQKMNNNNNNNSSGVFASSMRSSASSKFNATNSGSAPASSSSASWCSPVSWIRVKNNHSNQDSSSTSSKSTATTVLDDGDEDQEDEEEVKKQQQENSSLTMFMCTFSFLPTTTSDSLWRPSSSISSAASSFSGTYHSSSSSSTSKNDDNNNNNENSSSSSKTFSSSSSNLSSLVIPLRRTPCTILGFQKQKNTTTTDVVPRNNLTSTSTSQNLKLIIKGALLRLRVIPSSSSSSSSTLTKEEEKGVVPPESLSCFLSSPCLENVKFVCEKVSLDENENENNIQQQRMDSQFLVSGKTAGDEEEITNNSLTFSSLDGGDTLKNSKKNKRQKRPTFSYYSSASSSSSSNTATSSSSGGSSSNNSKTQPPLAVVDAITSDKVRFSCDIMTLKCSASHQQQNQQNQQQQHQQNKNTRETLVFGNFSLLSCTGWIPGEGEVLRCAFRMFVAAPAFSAQEDSNLMQLAGECVLILAMP